MQVRCLSRLSKEKQIPGKQTKMNIYSMTGIDWHCPRNRSSDHGTKISYCPHAEARFGAYADPSTLNQ